VAAATVKIQAAYKGFRTRQMIKQHKEVLPNLNCAKVQDATIKIQSAYRGFQTRKELKSAQQDLPDLRAADVAAATVKIQAAYRGFQTRQQVKRKTHNPADILPKAPDTDQSLIKDQSDEDHQGLPDLTAADVAAVTIKMQAAYKGLKTRKAKQQKDKDEINKAENNLASRSMQITGQGLPDIKAADVAAATIKIQSAFKGFRARKAFKEQKHLFRNEKIKNDFKISGTVTPDLEAADVANATLKIQAYYRGFKVRSAFRKQASRQQEAAANIAAAALLCRLGMVWVVTVLI
jgi:DNA-directed RNA polymerase subunit H (RpoH/RPB5)